MKIQLNQSKQKFLFLLGITAIYVALIAWLDWLQGSFWWDEKTFWQTSLTFSDRLLPTLDDLRDYQELNTPLPFVIFGGLEFFFGGGIFTGRLLNLVLSLVTIFIIGFPSRDKGGRALLCSIGLLMCPYYLWLSGRLYTEMITCFWIVMGFWGYVRNRHFVSCIAFILAIASRQYMLAFPAAIATYEFINCAIEMRRDRKIDLSQQWRWIAPAIAAMSILGWFYLFQGLAPETALQIRAPEVQKTTWAVTPGGAINFLAFVGLYIVIPEFVLFQPLARLESLKKDWRKVVAIAIGLLLYFFVFPPPLMGNGNVIKIVELLPHYFLKMALFYSLSLLACVRFLQPNLMGFLVLFNSLIMIKALPWDRYVLPLVVTFWYLKSIGLESQFECFSYRKAVTEKQNELDKSVLSSVR